MNSETSTTTTDWLPMSIWPAETYRLEPVQGWIHRAAERNYAFSTDTFVDSLGVSSRDWDYDELLKIVQQMPINGYAEIEHCTPKRSNQGYEICGHKVPFRFISKSERRVCPQCLEEERYVRTWFDFVPIATCPHHNVALVEGLPNDPLDWRHTEIGWTRSGVKVGSEHATPQIASKLDRFIVQSLTGGQVGLPDHLDGLSLRTILAASVCVGKLYRGDEKHIATYESVRSFCQLGFDPLVGGSDAIIDFLRRADWLQPGRDRTSYVVRCNGVPTMLLAINNKNLRHLIADTFARVRVRNGLATPSGRLSKYDGEDDHLNVKGAARRLGLSPHTMRVLLRKLAVDAKPCEHSRGHRLNQEQLASVQKYIEDSFGPEEAANRLGCTPQELKSLAARKLLQPAFHMSGRRHYTKSDLAGFVDRITAAAVDDPSLDGQMIKPLSEQVGISLAEACSRIIRDRSLVTVDHEPRSPLFEGLKVALSPKAMRRSGVRPNAQVRDAITYAEAAARLGTKYDGIKGLIEASLIGTVKDSRNKDRICPKSLELFECRYIKASAYAQVLGCHPTSALKILRTMGVLPINDRKSAGPRFIDREQVMRLTGLRCPEPSGWAGWQTIKEELDENLATHAVPATTRISPAPGIEVRATSGRWSFLIERKKEQKKFSLTSSFTSIRQRGRLKKVLERSIEPSEIWPGARVHNADGGGFVIVDETLESETDGSSQDTLVDRVITRAYQIHQIL